MTNHNKSSLLAGVLLCFYLFYFIKEKSSFTCNVPVDFTHITHENFHFQHSRSPSWSLIQAYPYQSLSHRQLFNHISFSSHSTSCLWSRRFRQVATYAFYASGSKQNGEVLSMHTRSKQNGCIYMLSRRTRSKLNKHTHWSRLVQQVATALYCNCKRAF